MTRHFFPKLLRKLPNHSLRALMPTVKDSSRKLRETQSQWPKANKERFNYSFVNRLIFKYNLSTELK